MLQPGGPAAAARICVSASCLFVSVSHFPCRYFGEHEPATCLPGFCTTSSGASDDSLDVVFLPPARSRLPICSTF